MKKTLLDTLKENFGDEYNIEEVNEYNSYNITEFLTAEGGEVYKLIIKKPNGESTSIWHTTADTILLQLLDYSL
jgi:hypothetical protein